MTYQTLHSVRATYDDVRNPYTREGFTVDVTVQRGNRQVTATITMAPDDAVPLGQDIYNVTSWAAGMLSALVLLRTGRTGPYQTARMARFAALETVSRLYRHTEAVIRALARAQARDGGSHGELARAMGIPRSSAQSLRASLEVRRPDEPEDWATGSNGTWRVDLNGDSAPGPGVSPAVVDLFRTTLIHLVKEAGPDGISAIDLNRLLVASGTSTAIPLPVAAEVLSEAITAGQISDDGTRYFYRFDVTG